MRSARILHVGHFQDVALADDAHEHPGGQRGASIRQRLTEYGVSDGEVNDFGAVRNVFFRDPDGLEGEVLVAK